MGLLLRAGVVASCGVMFAGAVLYLLRHGGERESYSVFHGVAAQFQSVRGIFREVTTGSARGIIQLGVLMLIATPVLRVAFAAFAFARQREWMFAWISLAVLGVLAFGLFEQG